MSITNREKKAIRFVLAYMQTWDGRRMSNVVIQEFTPEERKELRDYASSLDINYRVTTPNTGQKAA